jgi:DNA polymerase-1
LIAWDTETRSLRWWENPAFLATWYTGAGEPGLAHLPEHAPDHANLSDMSAFHAVLAGKHHRMANAKFDAHMAREATGIDIFKPGNRVDDAIIKSRLVYGQRRIGRHGLKELSEDFVDPDAQAAEAAMQARHKELTGRSEMKEDDAFYRVWKAFPHEVELYARKDASYTWDVDEFLDEQLDADPKIRRLYEEVERPLMEVLYRAEERGVHVDPEAVNRLRAQYEERMELAYERCEVTLGFIPAGTGRDEMLREALVSAGVPLTEKTKEGKLAVNKDALDHHAEHPAVQALYEFRRVDKFLSTYLNHLVDKDHIHPTFNQADAWTGRMSGNRPNMQNLPKRTEVGKDPDDKMRRVYIPEPGHEFIVADFESIEVFLLAHFVGVREYKDLVVSGDPHAHTAAVIWPQFGSWKNFTKATENRWLRDIAKQVTYTIVYGGGGKVIAATVNKYMTDAGRPDMCIDEDQARAIRRKITDNIPGFRELTDTPWKGRQYPSGRIHRQLKDSLIEEHLHSGELRHYGYVRTLMGRKQWIQMWPDEKAYVGLSGLIQGSAADLMKAAAINVFEAMKPHGGLPILFVHDELVCQVPLGWGERLKPIMVDAMEQACQIVDPPITVEATVTDRSYAHA